MTGYWIEKKERNTILWVRDNKLPCLECHYKVSSLIEGLEYQFRVYAMNLAGLSKASEASRPVVALNPVGEEKRPIDRYDRWSSSQYVFFFCSFL